MTDKKYIVISIKHTGNKKNGWYLWGKNKSGYVGTVDMAGLYSPEEFSDYPVVKMRKDIVRYYKKFDSVLVLKDEFISHLNKKPKLLTKYEIKKHLRNIEYEVDELFLQTTCRNSKERMAEARKSRKSLLKSLEKIKGVLDNVAKD